MVGLDDDWKFPTPEELQQLFKQEFTQQEKEEVWSDAAEVVSRYYDGLVVRWKEEMDTLLVYAGLFSAVLTAFIIESYPLLQAAPSDTTLAVLRQISAQLNSFSIDPPFANSTRTAQPLINDQSTFDPPLSAVWLNSLWFASLVFSLASASVALIVKQWLRHATLGLSGTSREVARRRQYHLSGLLKWHVGTIVATLPILLQIALFLFLIGLVVLLWGLHDTVATVTSSLVGILFAFWILVTVMPVVRWDCCYRSPQA
ncbi:hypothetical protein C8Q76DRAFT_673163, partial [Earliella scabrosa]